MPSGPSTIGITDSALTLLESVEVTKELEERIILDTDGSFADGKLIDPIISFSVKGRGESPKTLGVTVACGVTSITGGTTIIDRVKDTEKNDDFNGFEYSGKNFPGA